MPSSSDLSERYREDLVRPLRRSPATSGVSIQVSRLTGRVTKQLATIVSALALSLVGCGLLPSHGDPVELVTGDPLHGGCYTAQVAGLLVVDPTYGTAIVATNHGSMVQLSDMPATLAWPPGFTARRSGSEVEVLGPQGNTVAITGRSYQFWGGYTSAGHEFPNWPKLPTQLIWACGDTQLLP